MAIKMLISTIFWSNGVYQMWTNLLLGWLVSLKMKKRKKNNNNPNKRKMRNQLSQELD